jgi:putative ABC transport system permease protein
VTTPEASGRYEPKASGRYSLRRTVGSASAGTVALVLLVCGCVFAALAGPAVSLHTRSQALQQVVAGLDGPAKAVQVTATWSDFTTNLADAGTLSGPVLPNGALTQSGDEISRGLSGAGLHLAAGAWAGLTANPLTLAGAAPSANAGAPPRLEVAWRNVLPGNAQLVTGSYAGTAAPRGTLAVAATTQTAARFTLHPGSRLTITGPAGTITLFVTAIIRPHRPASTFWTQDSTVGVPGLVVPPYPGLPYWVGGVFADPDQFAAMQNAFNGPGMNMSWEFPLALGGLNASQAQGLYNNLTQATELALPLTGKLAAAANTLLVTAPLLQDLTQFLGTQAAIETVLLLLFVSLIVTGAAVILLAASMIVARRDAELTLLRARGGSLRQVAAVMTRAAAIATGPATLIGAGLAIALLPGRPASSALGWSLAAVAVAAALAGPPLIAAWQYRKPAPAANPARITSAETARRRIAWRRPVAEVTACAAAVGALVVLHNQGLPAAGSTDLYLAATPVLVAIPVVLVMLRLYPLVMRGLLTAAARGAGATGFVALSRAARSSLTGVLPAFGLVLALSLATFAGMVTGGIDRGETAASWQSIGADAAIKPGTQSGPVTPATVKAISAVRGVKAVTAVWNTRWVTAGGQPVTVTAVDPVSYAALVESTPFPAIPAGRLRTATGSGGIGALIPTVPVLASPQAAALLAAAAGTNQLSSLYAMGPVNTQVTGLVGSTPADATGGAFVVMAQQVLPGPNGQPAPNLILVGGSAIDRAQLTAVAGKVLPSSDITFRSDVLAALTDSPLQHGALLIIVLTIAAAAGFGLFIVILGLALGAAERELTLARLTIMGHERVTRLVMTEAMPAVLAAVVAGAACAVLLPHLIGSSIDLSAFTGTGAPVAFSPDLITLGLPAVVTCVLAAVALAGEARTLRGRDTTGMLRAN